MIANVFRTAPQNPNCCCFNTWLSLCLRGFLLSWTRHIFPPYVYRIFALSWPIRKVHLCCKGLCNFRIFHLSFTTEWQCQSIPAFPLLDGLVHYHFFCGALQRFRFRNNTVIRGEKAAFTGLGRLNILGTPLMVPQTTIATWWQACIPLHEIIVSNIQFSLHCRDVILVLCPANG